MQIMLEGVGTGKIIEADGREVTQIVRSQHIQPWEDQIGDLLADHRRTREIDDLVVGLKKLGDYIGLQEKTAPIKVEEEKHRSDLRLVGAMFITGEKFDERFGRKGLERF